MSDYIKVGLIVVIFILASASESMAQEVKGWNYSAEYNASIVFNSSDSYVIVSTFNNDYVLGIQLSSTARCIEGDRVHMIFSFDNGTTFASALTCNTKGVFRVGISNDFIDKLSGNNVMKVALFVAGNLESHSFTLAGSTRALDAIHRGNIKRTSGVMEYGI